MHKNYSSSKPNLDLVKLYISKIGLLTMHNNVYDLPKNILVKEGNFNFFIVFI
jgi:hypothetical protein